jgi:hypothetical protein
MKTKEQIEELAEFQFPSALTKECCKFGFIKGYEKCQNDNIKEVKIILEKVWNDIFNNETLTYNNFEDYYNNKIKIKD